MEFDLTPEITDEIIFAMEDQTGHFLFDSADCRCVASREPAGEGGPSDDDDDRYYALPVWDSVSGFRMMDRFAAQLRNPVVREELRSALSSGHGVFRSFKNILKARPEMERLWFQFKEREMRNIVRDWYNGLRDFWGLGRIGEEPEETGEIVSHDFTFRESGPDDENSLEILLSTIEREIAGGMPPGLSGAVCELRDRIRGPESEDACILVAETPEGEIVGAACSVPLPEDSFLAAQITQIGVFPEFRGLGIGKELLSRSVDFWTEKGYRWLLCASPLVPPSFIPALHRAGFAEKGHVSVLDLAESRCH